MLTAVRPRIRCRQIELSDTDKIADLLVRGFPGSAKSHWTGALKKLEDHPTPEGFPKFGYMIENEGEPVGVLLLIYTSVPQDTLPSVRCNVSSWYVDAKYRSFAPLLVSRALTHQPATYLNVSPAPHTWPIIEAQGFSRFCTGTFVAIPALIPKFAKAKIREFDPSYFAADLLSPEDYKLLKDHYNYGCLCLVCVTGGRGYPLILRRRRIKGGLIPSAQLLYCASIEILSLASGALGRYLLKRGMPLLLVGASGPIPLPGKYFHNKWPMYYQGRDKPQPADMTYTEAALFGI